MNLYIVTYDLADGNKRLDNGDTRYDSLKNCIDGTAQASCYLSDSSYMIETKCTSADQIMNEIEYGFTFEEDDRITISELTVDSVHRMYKDEIRYVNNCWK